MDDERVEGGGGQERDGNGTRGNKRIFWQRETLGESRSSCLETDLVGTRNAMQNGEDGGATRSERKVRPTKFGRSSGFAGWHGVAVEDSKSNEKAQSHGRRDSFVNSFCSRERFSLNLFAK